MAKFSEIILNGKKPARWTEKQKEGIRKTLKEVQSWTKLAEEWLEKYLEVE